MNAQPLNRDNIATILQANRFGRPVQYYTVIASTNDELKDSCAGTRLRELCDHRLPIGR